MAYTYIIFLEWRTFTRAESKRKYCTLNLLHPRKIFALQQGKCVNGGSRAKRLEWAQDTLEVD